MILLIDNYDSFTYNLVHYLCELGAVCEVRRNDQISVNDVEAMAPQAAPQQSKTTGPMIAGLTLGSPDFQRR